MKNPKIIRNRIRSIQSTKKITHTMEMVSAVKMRKEIEKTINMRPYAISSLKILENILSSLEGTGQTELAELIEPRKVINLKIIFIASDRGLCGAFNSKNLATLKKYIKTLNKGVIPKFVTIGKKGKPLLKSLNYNVEKEYLNIKQNPKLNDLNELAENIMEEYLIKKVDKILVLYTNYKNSLIQETKIRQIFPISIDEIRKEVEEMNTSIEQEKKIDLEKKHNKQKYIFEPSKSKLLKKTIISLTKIVIYHAILESNASKEASRMIAMKSATDTAGEMIEDLSLNYNQVRQSKITQEISEISAANIT